MPEGLNGEKCHFDQKSRRQVAGGELIRRFFPVSDFSSIGRSIGISVRVGKLVFDFHHIDRLFSGDVGPKMQKMEFEDAEHQEREKKNLQLMKRHQLKIILKSAIQLKTQTYLD